MAGVRDDDVDRPEVFEHAIADRLDLGRAPNVEPVRVKPAGGRCRLARARDLGCRRFVAHVGERDVVARTRGLDDDRGTDPARATGDEELHASS